MNDTNETTHAKEVRSTDLVGFPTPRTDAIACDGWSGDAICVDADFARELERENARLLARIEQMESGENLIMEIAHKVADEFKEENARLRESLKNMLLIAENGIPEPSHDGPCGPWVACDGNCEARAYCSEYMDTARKLLQPNAPRDLPPHGG